MSDRRLDAVNSVYIRVSCLVSLSVLEQSCLIIMLLVYWTMVVFSVLVYIVFSCVLSCLFSRVYCVQRILRESQVNDVQHAYIEEPRAILTRVLSSCDFTHYALGCCIIWYSVLIVFYLMFIVFEHSANCVCYCIVLCIILCVLSSV
jgi:hypothetical protein